MRKHYKIIALILAIVTAMAVPMLASASTSQPIYLVLDNARYKILISADVLNPIRTKGTISVEYIRGSIPDLFYGSVGSCTDYPVYGSDGRIIGGSHDNYELEYVNSFVAASVYTASNGRTVASASTLCSFLGYTCIYEPAA